MAKKILLADDSVTIQKVVELTLMDQDYQVVAVSDGDQALEQLGASQPDLVIADVHMPGPDGYEVCRQAKAARPGLPVILLVGSFEPFDTGRMAECGAELHLKKPFDSQELLRTVEELLEGAPVSHAPAAAEPASEQPEEVRNFMAESSPAPAPPVPSLEPSTAPVESVPSLPEVSSAAVPKAPEPISSVPSVPDVPVAPPLPEPLAVDPVSVATPANGSAALSDADIERIAQRVIDAIGERVIREVAWDVIPDLAEIVIRERLRELESQVE